MSDIKIIRRSAKEKLLLAASALESTAWDLDKFCNEQCPRRMDAYSENKDADDAEKALEKWCENC